MRGSWVGRRRRRSRGKGWESLAVARGRGEWVEGGERRRQLNEKKLLRFSLLSSQLLHLQRPLYTIESKERSSRRAQKTERSCFPLDLLIHKDGHRRRRSNVRLMFDVHYASLTILTRPQAFLPLFPLTPLPTPSSSSSAPSSPQRTTPNHALAP